MGNRSKYAHYVFYTLVSRAHLIDADFIKEYPQYVSKDNAMDYMSDDGGKSYNLCHCTCIH